MRTEHATVNKSNIFQQQRTSAFLARCKFPADKRSGLRYLGVQPVGLHLSGRAAGRSTLGADLLRTGLQRRPVRP